MGGNYTSTSGIQTTPLDIRLVERTKVVNDLTDFFDRLNNTFKKAFGIELWSNELLKSKRFISGSGFHFMNLDGVDTKTLTEVKPTIGDIDLQIDSNLESEIKELLVRTNRIGKFLLIDHTKSGTQIITLWEYGSWYVQMDFEFVEYEKGAPSEWSTFSKSSDYNDLLAGIKGVFAKYMLRALTTKFLIHGTIKAKTARGTDKTGLHPTVAFSVDHGVREKYNISVDDQGKIILTDKPANYTKDLNEIFIKMFDHKPSQEDLKAFGSFTGQVSLISKYIEDTKTIQLIAEGFWRTLFFKGAQGLYKGNPKLDKETKLIAWRHLTSKLKMVKVTDEMKNMLNTYYQN
jgi:hypothetical protein